MNTSAAYSHLHSPIIAAAFLFFILTLFCQTLAVPSGLIFTFPGPAFAFLGPILLSLVQLALFIRVCFPRPLLTQPLVRCRHSPQKSTDPEQFFFFFFFQKNQKCTLIFPKKKKIFGSFKPSLPPSNGLRLWFLIYHFRGHPWKSRSSIIWMLFFSKNRFSVSFDRTNVGSKKSTERRQRNVASTQPRVKSTRLRKKVARNNSANENGGGGRGLRHRYAE